ncbi:MAG: hypothetical protein MUP82_00765 [Candidatus Marinimicrobia bacterium]|nr:hypothetical protein [Candidatus Neomarinimicrobiota bacterium]
MVVKSNDKIVYDSWKDGSDIYKDKKGYYTIQWNPKTEMSYKKYLPASWKPKVNKTKKIIIKNKKLKTKTHKSFWNIFSL